MSDALTANDPLDASAPLRAGVRRLLLGYLLLVVVLSAANGGLSPDALIFIVIAAALTLVVTGTGATGWLSLLLLFAAWQAMRGLAATFGHAVVVEPMVALERVLAFGLVPSVELQRLFHHPGALSALDMGLTGVYLTLVVPMIALAVVLSRHAQPIFYRFLLALLALSLSQFAFALLVPVAPPRLAADYGVPLAIVDIVGQAWAGLGEIGTWLYTQSIGNPVAALPSLHAAYPVLAFLVAREVWPRAAWILGVWAGIVFFAVLYLGHHYLVDVYAGIALAVVVHHLVRRWWQRALEPVESAATAGGSLPIPTDG
jgi:hypothetical protein